MDFETHGQDCFPTRGGFAKRVCDPEFADRFLTIPPIVEAPAIAADAVHEQTVDDFDAVRLHGVNFDAATPYGFLAEPVILHHDHRECAGDLQIVSTEAQTRENQGANRMHWPRMDRGRSVDNMAM